MPGQDFDVRSRLTLETLGAERGAARAASRIDHLNDRVRTAATGFGGLTRTIVGFGGAYLGISLAQRAFSGLTRSAITYTSELESAKIGITSVIAAVEQAPWDRATARAEEAFGRIKEMAIESPGTSQQMFGIFKSILGPIEAAGFSMDKVLSITNDSMLAAAALGVDFEQAARDVNLMATGAAGADVKLFRLLRATGAIKEDTESWNKTLLPAERVNKLSAALAQYRVAGERFGKSWAGVTSTFEDVKNELKREAFTPIMAAVGRELGRFNQSAIANRKGLSRELGNAGKGVTRIFDEIFSRVDYDKLVKGIEIGANRFGMVASRVGSWVGSVIDNWDAISARIVSVLPMLKVVALAYGVSKLGAFSPLLQPLLAGGGAGSAAAVAAGTADRAGIAKLDSSIRFARGFSLLGGAENKADNFFGHKAAAVGKALIMPDLPRLLGVAGAFTEGPPGAAEQARGQLHSGIGLGVGMLGTAGMALAAGDHAKGISAAFGPQFDGLVESLIGFGDSLWGAIGPIIKLIGMANLGILGALFTVLGTSLRAVGTALTPVLNLVGSLSSALYDSLGPAFEYALEQVQAFAAMMNELFRDFLIQTSADRIRFSEEEYHAYKGKLTGELDSINDPAWAMMGLEDVLRPTVPKARKPTGNVNVDARGSRVTIKQEFPDTDPDRILQLMMDDLIRQGESRLSSVFAGAFTR